MKQPDAPTLYVFNFACEVCGKEIERFVPVRVGICYACRQAKPWRDALDQKLATLGRPADETNQS